MPDVEHGQAEGQPASRTLRPRRQVKAEDGSPPRPTRPAPFGTDPRNGTDALQEREQATPTKRRRVNTPFVRIPVEDADPLDTHTSPAATHEYAQQTVGLQPEGDEETRGGEQTPSAGVPDDDRIEPVRDVPVPRIDDIPERPWSWAGVQFWVGPCHNRQYVKEQIVAYGGTIVDEAQAIADSSVFLLVDENSSTRRVHDRPVYNASYVVDCCREQRNLEIAKYLLTEHPTQPHTSYADDDLPYGPPPPVTTRGYSQEESDRLLMFLLDEAKKDLNVVRFPRRLSTYKLAVEKKVTMRPAESMRTHVRQILPTLMLRLSEIYPDLDMDEVAKGGTPTTPRNLEHVRDVEASPGKTPLSGVSDPVKSSGRVPYSAEEDQRIVAFFVDGAQKEPAWIEQPKRRDIWKLASEQKVTHRPMESMRNRVAYIMPMIVSAYQAAEAAKHGAGQEGGGMGHGLIEKPDILAGSPHTPGTLTKSGRNRMYSAEEDDAMIDFWAQEAMIEPKLRVQPFARMVWEKAARQQICPGRSVSSMRTHFRDLQEVAIAELNSRRKKPPTPKPVEEPPEPRVVETPEGEDGGNMTVEEKVQALLAFGEKWKMSRDQVSTLLATVLDESKSRS